MSKAAATAPSTARNPSARPHHRAAPPALSVLQETLVLRGFPRGAITAHGDANAARQRSRRAMMHAAVAERRAPHFRFHCAPHSCAAARKNCAQSAAHRDTDARHRRRRVHGGEPPPHARRKRSSAYVPVKHRSPNGDRDRARARHRILAACVLAGRCGRGIGARDFATRGEILKICGHRRSHGRSETSAANFLSGVANRTHRRDAPPECRNHLAVRKIVAADRSRRPTRNGPPRSTAARSPMMM